jgi:hypothetical protein
LDAYPAYVRTNDGGAAAKCGVVIATSVVSIGRRESDKNDATPARVLIIFHVNRVPTKREWLVFSK